MNTEHPKKLRYKLAMNPCPCGNYGVRGAECVCPSLAIRRYATRLSGPLRDRIDIELQVARVSAARATSPGSSHLDSRTAAQRVVAARARTAERLGSTPWRLNSEVPGPWLRQTARRVSAEARRSLDRALERGALTLRGYDRVLRLAWTMADLGGVDAPGTDEVGRALFLKKGRVA